MKGISVTRHIPDTQIRCLECGVDFGNLTAALKHVQVKRHMVSARKESVVTYSTSSSNASSGG